LIPSSTARRAVRSAAIMVVPDPSKQSSPMLQGLQLLRMARSTRATGFMVGYRSHEAEVAWAVCVLDRVRKNLGIS
jgi:hypothetical protein